MCAAIEVRPATPERWRDVVAVLGRRGEDPTWCWCQLFLRSGSSQEGLAEPGRDNRAALQREIERARVSPGLVAYVDGRPAGWTRVGPRRAFPALRTNRALAKVLTGGDAGTWWVTCFAVDARQRRTGVGSALLEAAVDFARKHGAMAVEGHPVDVGTLTAGRVGGAALYTGTAAMFAAAGFVEVGRTHRSRPVMRLVL